MINRNNYEEFLLMYVDNELTAQERTAVELFVQQNPDLLPELKTLQQTVLSNEDEVLYDGKAALLKINSSISIGNYEEYFLLNIDNELDAAAKHEVEKFVLQHPKLQEEFTLLKQTVLEPEHMVFEHKQSLYRKEERRVVPFAWMRLAAAAAVIGFALLFWWLTPAVEKNDEVANVKPVKENPAILQNENGKNAGQSSVNPQQQIVADIAGVTPAQENKSQNLKTDKINTKQAVLKGNATGNKNVAVNNKQNNKAVISISEKTVPVEKEDIIAYQEPVIIMKGDQETANTFANNQTPAVANHLVKQVVYKELDTEDDMNSSLYVGNLNLNKNKLRGVMKKVGGLFAGKAKNAVASNDQGKLQVANLEFNKN